MLVLRTVDLDHGSNSMMSILDVRGRVIGHLEAIPRGREFEFVWDGRNDRDEKAPAGLYLFRLSTPYGVVTKKVFRIR